MFVHTHTGFPVPLLQVTVHLCTSFWTWITADSLLGKPLGQRKKPWDPPGNPRARQSTAQSFQQYLSIQRLDSLNTPAGFQYMTSCSWGNQVSSNFCLFHFEFSLQAQCHKGYKLLSYCTSPGQNHETIRRQKWLLQCAHANKLVEKTLQSSCTNYMLDFCSTSP